MSTSESLATLAREIELPDGVTASLETHILTVNGPLGTCTKDFSSIRAKVTMNGNNKIRAEPFSTRKKHLATLGTTNSIIRNLVTGVTLGYTYKLKMAFAHFPMTVKVASTSVNIENSCGERTVRRAKIVGDTTASVNGDDVIVQGINLEHVSQTAANIEQMTKVKKKDQRVFLDGIYLYEKGSGMNA